MRSETSWPSITETKQVLPNFVSFFRARLMDSCARPAAGESRFRKHVSQPSKERHETPLKVASSPRAAGQHAVDARAKPQRSPHATGAPKNNKNVRHEVRRRPRRVRQRPRPGRQQRLPREDDLRAPGTRENRLANGEKQRRHATHGPIDHPRPRNKSFVARQPHELRSIFPDASHKLRVQGALPKAIGA